MIWENLGPGCRTDMEPAPSGPRRWALVAKPGTQVLPWMEVGDSYPVAPKRSDREMCSPRSQRSQHPVLHHLSEAGLGSGLQLCDPSMEEQLLNIHVCAPRLPWGATGIVSLVHGQGEQLRLSQEFLLSSQCDVQGSASARTGKGVGELWVGRPGLEPNEPIRVRVGASAWDGLSHHEASFLLYKRLC